LERIALWALLFITCLDNPVAYQSVGNNMMNKQSLSDIYRGKKVLVTGHTGFKGAWLTLMLNEFGAKVTGYSLNFPTEPNLFSVLGLEKRVDSIIGDIRDFKKFNKIVKEVKPDIIFHLAAQPLVRDSYSDPIYTYETNVIGTANVCEAMAQNSVPAGVMITTDKVYRNLEIDYAYKEDDPLGGHDPYSNSKACADLVVSSYIKSFFDQKEYGKKHNTLLASVRAGNVIGGGDWAKDRLIPDAVRFFLDKNEELTIRYPKATRPWQHVFEPLNGYLILGSALLNKEANKVGAWNFGPDDADMQSVANVMDLVIKTIKKGSYRVEKADTHEAGNLKLDSSKAKSGLNWQPKYDLKKAVEETVLWYQYFYEKKGNIEEYSKEKIKKYFN
jgi:CDP-glucose 4,6-dehydratase